MTEITHTDKELILQLAAGNKAAFRKIYEFYWEKLFAFVFNFLHDREESKEIVQEVFISLWVKRTKLDYQKGTLNSYLFSMAKNRVLNFIRSKNVREKYAMDFIAYQNNSPNF